MSISRSGHQSSRGPRRHGIGGQEGKGHTVVSWCHPGLKFNRIFTKMYFKVLTGES